jgi:hypothetical protein
MKGRLIHMDPAGESGSQAELAAIRPVLMTLAADAMIDPQMRARSADEHLLLRALIDQVPDLLFVKDTESR